MDRLEINRAIWLDRAHVVLRALELSARTGDSQQAYHL